MTKSESKKATASPKAAKKKVSKKKAVKKAKNELRDILKDTEGVAFVELGGRDVVRHPLVRRIVDAFDAAGVETSGD